MRKKVGFSLLMVVTLLLINITTVAAQHESEGPEIVPVDTKVYGKTYGQWSDAWEQWILSLHSKDNPFTSSTCIKTNQPKKVFFLVGTDGHTITCVIPEDTFLFFPIINFAFFEDPKAEDPNFNPPYVPATWVRFLREAFAANKVSLKATIDRVPVKGLTQYLVSTNPKKPFSAHIMVDNVLFPPGTITEPLDWIGVNVGYYLMLRPLDEGKHVIEFTASVDKSSTLKIPPGVGGELTVAPFTVHTKYLITVKGDREREND